MDLVMEKFERNKSSPNAKSNVNNYLEKHLLK